VLGDQIPAWMSPKQERSHLVLTNGLSKREYALELNPTTPGFDLNSLAGKLHVYGLKVNSGEIKDPEFLFVHWGCPPDRYPLDTLDGVLAAIRNASPAADLFLNVGHVAAKKYQIDELEFHRYHLGRLNRRVSVTRPHAQPTLASQDSHCPEQPRGRAPGVVHHRPSAHRALSRRHAR